MTGKFKKLLSFNRPKFILSIFLILFAPLPLCAIVFLGIAPPAWLLLLIPGIGAKPLFIVVALVLFIIHAFFAYFIACILVWIVKMISHDNRMQWAIISTLLIALFAASFFHIYGIVDVGGGRQNPNILELFSGTIRGY